jgi:hypothetical protein
MRRRNACGLAILVSMAGFDAMALAQDTVAEPWGAMFADNNGTSRATGLPIHFGPGLGAEVAWAFDAVANDVRPGSRFCFDEDGNIYWHSVDLTGLRNRIASVAPYGTLRWAAPVRGLGQGASLRGPVVGHDAVYTLSDRKYTGAIFVQFVYALGKTDGAELWQTMLDNEPDWDDAATNPTPLLHEGTLYVLGRPDPETGAAVYQIDAATGTIEDNTKVGELNVGMCELAMTIKPDAFDTGVHGLYILTNDNRVFAVAVDCNAGSLGAGYAWDVEVGGISPLALAHPIYNPSTDRVYVYTHDDADGFELTSLDPLTGDDGESWADSGVGHHGAWASGALDFDDHTIMTGGPDGSLLMYEDDGAGNLGFIGQIAGEAWWGHPRPYLQLIGAGVDGEDHTLALFATDADPNTDPNFTSHIVMIDVDDVQPDGRARQWVCYATGESGGENGNHIIGGPSLGPDGKIYYFTAGGGDGTETLYALQPRSVHVTPIAPADGSVLAGPDIQLSVNVENPAQCELDVTFFGRRRGDPEAEPFMIVALPDTQYYSASYPYIFEAQTQWVVDNRDALSIAYVAHLGDIVDSASQLYQWENADAAISILDTLPDLPYGLCVGNHDQWPGWDPDGTQYFNMYFPFTRYEGVVPWYGGHYGGDNDNHFILFSGGGIDLIAIHFEYDDSADPAVLAWADELLQRYSHRPAIVASHCMIGTGNPGGFMPQGAAIYNALRHNPNLFLMLCGHFHGEGQRVDVFEGNTVYTLLSDYQGRPNGGDGWLRIMEFAPADDEIRVQTYSPTLDQFETDADSQFTLDYEMYGVPFVEIGTVTGVPSAEENVELLWTELEAGRTYEWYVAVTDGESVAYTPVWSFETAWCPGDLDGDDDVDLQDLAIVLSHYGVTGGATYEDGDFDGDGDVDLTDLARLLAAYGTSCE